MDFASVRGKSVLLIIGGGIAAYKSLELVRRLAEHGVKTRAILTSAGAEFVTPLSVAALTGEKIYSDLFSLTDEAEMGHIQLSRSADLVVVAPATADLMAKMANGLAGDLAGRVSGNRWRIMTLVGLPRTPAPALPPGGPAL